MFLRVSRDQAARCVDCDKPLSLHPMYAGLSVSCCHGAPKPTHADLVAAGIQRGRGWVEQPLTISTQPGHNRRRQGLGE